MSRKTTRTDLLVKIRYQNTLPPPPSPPKFIDIPTDVRRYARPEFLDAVANDAPLPMIVDADLGMPLDGALWEALWSGPDANPQADRALNPDARDKPALDPRDAALLIDPSAFASSSSSSSNPSSATAMPSSSAAVASSLFTSAVAAPHANGNGFGLGEGGARSSGRSTPATPSSVTWLRRTEYLSRDTAALSRAPTSEPVLREERPDVSRSAQLRSIEASFALAADADANASDLSSLRHPTKRGVRALSSLDVLPDASIWANEYDLFRFSERPGDRGPELDDPRLSCAIMRPMESDGEHFLAYYLPPADADAHRHRSVREDETLGGIEMAEGEADAVEFGFVRDYEVVKVEQDVPGEFLLVLDEEGRSGRGAGAYYKNIERKMLLKKKRTEPIERFQNKWSLIRVHHEPPGAEEAAERADAQAEVDDPDFALRAVADADGEGEAEDEFGAAAGMGAGEREEEEEEKGGGMPVEVDAY